MSIYRLDIPDNSDIIFRIMKSRTSHNFEEYTYMSDLVAFYGNLLDLRSFQMMKRYYFDNVSYEDIAREHRISRQRVHQIISQQREILKEWEKTLHFLQFVEKIRLLMLHYRDKSPELVKELEQILEKSARGE